MSQKPTTAEAAARWRAYCASVAQGIANTQGDKLAVNHEGCDKDRRLTHEDWAQSLTVADILEPYARVLLSGDGYLDIGSSKMICGISYQALTEIAQDIFENSIHWEDCLIAADDAVEHYLDTWFGEGAWYDMRNQMTNNDGDS